MTQLCLFSKNVTALDVETKRRVEEWLTNAINHTNVLTDNLSSTDVVGNGYVDRGELLLVSSITFPLIRNRMLRCKST